MVGKEQEALLQVTVIVDANIVFSSILNTNGKLADLLLNSGSNLRFVAPDFLRIEIKKHHRRLARISGMSIEEVQEAERHVCRAIRFIKADKIRPSSWKVAIRLVADVDPKDAVYVAFTNHFRCGLWSGDKQLIRGLTRKGFTNFIATDELLALREKGSG